MRVRQGTGSSSVGPGFAAEAGWSGRWARLYRLDENDKIKAEQIVFFAVPN